MLAKETFVRARVDLRLKRDTEKILGGLGLTTAEAIRIYLHQIRLHKGLPFDLRLQEDNSDLLLPAKLRQAALDEVYDA
jgi:DNA-damage-inducible protein J